MSPAVSPRPNVAVLRSEPLDAPALQRAFRFGTMRQVLIYVERVPDETLLSWVLRLATPLKVSPHVLARECFGID
jgi:hypothetical protein